MLKCTKCPNKNTCTDAISFFNDLDNTLEKMKTNSTADIKLFALDIEKVLSGRKWECEKR